MSDNVTGINIAVKHLHKVLYLFFTLNILFLLGTAFIYTIYADQVNKRQMLRDETVGLIIDELNLGNENNLAAWYSSMLLLSVGLIAVVCYRVENLKIQRHKIFATGWLVIATFFILLSFDELGSLHENAGQLTLFDVMDDRSWESVVVIPGILVIVFMIIFAWLHLRKNYSTTFFMGLGTLLYVTVPFQEHFEIQLYHENQFNDSWRRPAWHVVFEEGSELFGSLSFFAAFALYIRSKIITGDIRFNLTYKNMLLILGTMALFGLGAYMLIYQFKNVIVSSDGGTASNWLPSALAFLICVFFFFYAVSNRYVIAFFLIISAYFGTNFYTLIYWTDIIALTSVIELLLFTGIIVFVYKFRKYLNSKEWQIILFVASAILFSTFISSNIIVTPIAFFALILLAFVFIVRAKTDLCVKVTA
jgi:hypothetical protein